MCNEIDARLRELVLEHTKTLCKLVEKLAAENARLRREWTSVDEPPKDDHEYLVTGKTADQDKPFVLMAWFNPLHGDWELIPQTFVNAITHWMQLPSAPEEARA